ncbi:MAG TPA: hypothetical protein VK205_02455, partial [Prolixibacteraceae bacterium]|nr:hypothetical protein [Prolixibacteraceae bacterium]
MAKYSGIFGAYISGKVGKLVYYTSNGKKCVRSLPKKSEKEPSPVQVMNRQRFLMMTKFCNQFKYVVIPQIWNLAAKQMSGRNLFMKTNKAAFDAQGKVSDPMLLKLSTGKLLMPSLVQCQRHEAGSTLMDVDWTENYYKGGISYWDELLVISMGEGQFSLIENTGIKRGDLKGSFELPALKVAATHVYLFFATMDR